MSIPPSPELHPVAGGANIIQMHGQVRKLGVEPGRHFGNRRPACKLVSAIDGDLAIRCIKRCNAFWWL